MTNEENLMSYKDKYLIPPWEHNYVIKFLTLCMLGNFFMFFCDLLTFFFLN